MQRKRPVDALLFHTQVTAILAQDWMDKIPSIVSLDATPLQYDSLGEFYEHESGSGSAEKLKFWLNNVATTVPNTSSLGQTGLKKV